MREMLVAGNWKMHGTRAGAAALVAAIDAAGEGPERAPVAVAVFPPIAHLDIAIAARGIRALAIGAQDVSDQRDDGAYTGEVSGAMLRDAGASHVLVGHSERRQRHAESDRLVAAKFIAAQAAGLTPILCIGETLTEREADATEAVLARQLDAVLDGAGVAAFANAVIAYEPVWAIGTGRTASTAQAEAAHRFIRGKVENLDAIVARCLRVLYGGSVKPGNALELFAQPNVDGGLVGGASLVAADFNAIIASARQAALAKK